MASLKKKSIITVAICKRPYLYNIYNNNTAIINAFVNSIFISVQNKMRDGRVVSMLDYQPPGGAQIFRGVK